jgi:hypothetical protein
MLNQTLVHHVSIIANQRVLQHNRPIADTSLRNCLVALVNECGLSNRHEEALTLMHRIVDEAMEPLPIRESTTFSRARYELCLGSGGCINA